VTANRARLSMAGFLARTFGLAIAFFALSWLALQPIALATGTAASRLLEAISPVNDARVRVRGTELDFEISPSTWQGRDAVLEVQSRSITYIGGLPLFLALLLASRPRGTAWKVVAGVAVLVLLAGLGIWCDVRLQLAAVTGPRGEALMPLGAAAREALAVAYQFTALLAPTLVPVMLWAAFDPGAIRELSARPGAADGH
jgi:hypothetical protein